MDEKVLLLILAAGLSVIGTLFVWGVKACVTALFTNTTEVKKFRDDISRVLEEMKAIPKLKEDINEFHRWKREIQERERK